MEIAKHAWITVSRDTGDVCPVFRRTFDAGNVIKAELAMTALGVYVAELNGHRVGDFILAPGWTSYANRLQVQTYDVTTLLQEKNDLRVTVGRGWFRSPMPGWVDSEDKRARYAQPCGLIALLTLYYADGHREELSTDETWQWSESAIRFSEIYDGEHYDARFMPAKWQSAALLDWSRDIFIPQEGEIVREQAVVQAQRIFCTPKGECVIDFGQEVTGYVSFTLDAKAGDVVRYDHAEVMDASGNFYNENYRTAKAEVQYICRDGIQSWKPQLTFFGFRYIRLLNWPGKASSAQFRAIVVHSDLLRTGYLSSGDETLNKLFSNIAWGQRGNFLDVPTDCPQRDERLGWTGDAQAFCKTASYFYDVERFFRKWLHDMSADQRASGEIGQVIPDYLPDGPGSAAWSDAATICPWQIYQTYGDKQVLADQFACMKKWVDYITSTTNDPGLWTGHFHFGDWLGLDAPSGSYKGSSREDFIATAFYALSTSLVVKAGTLLGEDIAAYQKLYDQIVSTFRATYPTYETQTEHILAVHFGLAVDPQKTADALADLVRRDGTQLRTGFVGTPYLLHVLSQYGHATLAWDLLLRRSYPGWLYPVTKGATTIWEHWDGIREDGTFWSKDMNSYNHYAYGAVADWVFEQAAGISHSEDAPGFSALIYAPKPDPRIGWLTASLNTRHGIVKASWHYEGSHVRYELETPVSVTVCIGGHEQILPKGNYTFWM